VGHGIFFSSKTGRGEVWVEKRWFNWYLRFADNYGLSVLNAILDIDI